MKSFINVQDLGPLDKAMAEAFEIKNDRYKYQHLGKNKTLMMIFFNNSLRTRLSTQKAAMNLGMNVIVLDVNAGAWKLETERGVIMDGDKSEHLLEAIPVMGCYCDLIGVRSFAGLTDREYDYAETVLHQFIKYSGKPVFAMETATVHPLQAFADLITIEEHKTVERPKVVLTWAPHCRALPQAVPNSFAEWMNAAEDIDLVITHPKGYELDPKFVGNACVEYDQKKAFKGADFIYAKNWSNPGVTNLADYGKITCEDRSWTVDTEHMSWTNNGKFMHCLPVRRNLIVTDDVIQTIIDYGYSSPLGVASVLRLSIYHADCRPEDVRQERRTRGKHQGGPEDDFRLDRRVIGLLCRHLLPLSRRTSRESNGISGRLSDREITVDG